ncbi:MAG: cation:dicarboxylate symporter family transporter [Faecalibacterium prausnitzii]
MNWKLTGQFRKVATLDDGPVAGLLEAIGMPLTLIPILAAIWPAIDPIHTLMNNISDLVGTMLIARQLDKVDMNVYNS